VKIAIGADHAGYALKTDVSEHLTSRGHEVLDLGTTSPEPVDYPPLCAAVGRAVVARDADFGIVLGGTGQGEQIAANKVRGVRAALCLDLYTARLARAHNDANVLSLGGRVVAAPIARDIVDTFLASSFEGGRHQRRIDLIAEIEHEELRTA
jgi:ribose 5-phosphate isomerase B